MNLDTKPAQCRRNFPATVEQMAARAEGKTTTPWGASRLVEQLTLPQRAGTKRFATVVQLLEADDGERMVRFAYTTGGVARRGPVTLRPRDLERLHVALTEHPALAAALDLGGGA